MFIKRVLIELACRVRLHRLADVLSMLVRESRRRQLQRHVRGQLHWVDQGAGGIDIAGDPSRFEIGVGSHLKSNTFIECSGGVTIGSYFHSARGLTIFSSRHVWKNADRIPYSAQIEDAPVIIGDCVWAGVNVTILPGTTVGDGAILAAGAVVRGHIPKGALVAGNPATVIGYRDLQHFDEKYAAQDFF